MSVLNVASLLVSAVEAVEGEYGPLHFGQFHTDSYYDIQIAREFPGGFIVKDSDNVEYTVVVTKRREPK